MVFPLRRASVWAKYGAVAAVLLTTVWVYGGSLHAEFVRFDDDLLVTENPVVRVLSVANIAKAFSMYDPELYIPLTFVSYQIDATLGGLDPFAFHFTNLFLHLLNALLVTLIIALLSRGKVWVAITAGALFALHPINTEAVLWVSARKDLLSTVFFLLSILLYLGYREDERKTLYWFSIGAFLLSLLSKVSVLTLPAILLLLDWYRDGRLSRMRMSEKLPYAVLSILFGIVALFGKSQALSHGSPMETIIMAGRSTVFYLEKLFVPFGFSVLYPHEGFVTLTDVRFSVSWIIVVALLTLAWIMRHRVRAISCASLFFLITLFPTFLNARRGDGFSWFVASDRYAYVPAMAVFALLAAGLFTYVRVRHVATIAGILCVMALGFLAKRQAAVWDNSESLFLNVLEHEPRAELAYNNLGTVYHRRGDLANAERAYREALAIHPQAKTWSNLGTILRERGSKAEASAAFQNALAINPEEPAVHFALGLFHAQSGDAVKAREAYLRSAELKPEDARPWLNLGALAMQSGDVEGAVRMYDEALERNPYYVNADFNRAVALERLRRFDEAVASYERILQLDPAFEPARINLERLK